MKQFVGKVTNCLSVFDHFVGLALKGLRVKAKVNSCTSNYQEFFTKIRSTFTKGFLSVEWKSKLSCALISHPYGVFLVNVKQSTVNCGYVHICKKRPLWDLYEPLTFT